MRSAADVASMGDTRTEFRFSVRKPEGYIHFKYLEADGRKLLKWISKNR
jgi:hypothetical protein